MRVAGVIFALALFAPSLAGAETKTTVYTYNKDGALTSITETTEGTPGSTTTYFTWDNFEADPSMPSTGTVTAANGNLVGYGPSPGDASGWSGRYDLLDRLVQVTNAQRQRAQYAYHPDELLAASLNADQPSSDGLQHYYDESRYPQATNLYDRQTGTVSSRHHRIRYLPNGTEQMLVRHRKDVDGVYDLGAQTMSGYRYDPYGASFVSEPGTGPGTDPVYGLESNPYRYTDELNDPVSGAYYLRARWYLPAHQTFLQRDPVRNVNRYGYANGNPIANVDPAGTSAQSFLRRLNSRTFAGQLWRRVLLSPALPFVQLAAEPKSFWHSSTDIMRMAETLGIGVAAELAFSAPVERLAGTGLTFFLRILTDQGVAYGTGRLNHMAGKDLWLNQLTAFGGSVYGRALLGIGYRRFHMTVGDVENAIGHVPQGQMRVFEMQESLYGRVGRQTAPLAELSDRGLFHSRLIAVDSGGRVLSTENDVYFRYYETNVHEDENWFAPRGPRKQLIGSRARFSFLDRGQFREIGDFDAQKVEQAFKSNPLGVAVSKSTADLGIDSPPKVMPYRLLWRNCQMQTTSVIRQLKSSAAPAAPEVLPQ